MPNNFWPQLTRLTKVRAGYDRTSEGYGKHPPEIDFVVKGAEGAVVYTVCTGWYFTNYGASDALAYPYSVGISRHAVPTQALLADLDPSECSHVEGGLCCSRFLGTHGDLLETLKRQGDDPIFLLLEEIYRQEFS